MRTYELVVIASSNLSEVARKKLLDTVKVWLKEVKIVKEEDWGSKALAYRIKGQLQGHYYDLHLEAETVPADFEKRLLDSDEVLRHLLLRVK